MPALIGGFGKIAYNILLFKQIKFLHTIVGNKEDLNELRSKIGAYLAGLIEADGSIAVHDINSKAKRYRPKILIVFAVNDKPLAEKLVSITKAGIIYSKLNAGHIL